MSTMHNARTLRFALATAAMILASVPARAEAHEASPAKTALNIAIVDFAEIPGLAPPPPRVVSEPAWRTTFGSERVSAPKVEFNSEALAPLADVDAVLIQGVKADARLRRLFPPRTWRLIVSRRMLSETDPVGFRSARSDLPPTTAIAVKARSDLRITARALTLSLAAPGAAPAPGGREDPAATAVRLIDPMGRTLWLVSIALPEHCNAGGDTCPARAMLEAWRQERRASDEFTLVGGSTVRDAAAAGAAAGDHPPPAPCIYTVESDLPWTRSKPQPVEDSTAPSDTCISLIRIGS